MFDIFKKKNQSTNESVPQNDFLSNENAAFNTVSSEDDSFKDSPDYQSLVYQEPVYNVPKYKASNLSNIGVVVNSTDVGFDRNSINPNIKTIDIPSNEQEELNKSIKTEEPVELLDIFSPTSTATNDDVIPEVTIDDSTNNNVNNNNTNNNINNSSINNNVPTENTVKEKSSSVFVDSNEPIGISIFGSNDGVTNKNNYTSSNQFEEQKQELIKEVEYTSDGNKICPNCGAILKPDAPICFMCSKSFILKK